MLDRTDQFYIQMVEAWRRGVSPYEFRKCLSSDLQFISEFENAMYKKQKQKIENEKREQVIKEAMNNIMRSKQW